MNQYKTWVEINQKSLTNNVKTFRALVAPKTQLWSVVKSNAYGHGLGDFAQLAETLGIDGFCVDSVTEGLKLRKNGLKKPILVLGPTLFPDLSESAKNENITITVSNFDALNTLIKSAACPQFHIKIDSGMHRQGFYLKDLPKLVKKIKAHKLRDSVTGVYTHFASAKDLNYPTYTDFQFANFQKAVSLLEKGGLKNIVKHAAATGGTLINQKYHLDAVRVGIGLYGLWPSKELMLQRDNIVLEPILSWHSIVSEVKMLEKGDFVGYDLAERVSRPTKIGILPIGYWHGFPRALSGIGEVLINGKRARVIGRVSMDLIAANITGISCKPGDKATIIGSQKNEELSAFDIAQKIGTIHYELITRINPLIKRVIK